MSKIPPPRKLALLGLAIACASVALWTDGDTSSEAKPSARQEALLPSLAHPAGPAAPISLAGIAPASQATPAYAIPTPDTPAQAKLGGGQLLQALKSFANRHPATRRGQLSRAQSVAAQIAALDRAGIPHAWRRNEKVMVDIGLALPFAARSEPALVKRATHALSERLRADGIDATPVVGAPYLEALVPLDRLESVASLGEIARIGLRIMGSPTAYSQGATASSVDTLSALGNAGEVPQALRDTLSGDDLTIAIIDLFGNVRRTEGAIDSLRDSGDWPSVDQSVLTPSSNGEFGFDDEKHGNAVTEIVYDIAPDANYRLYDVSSNAFVNDWIAAIQDAANLDEDNQPMGAPRAQVITASLGITVPATPGDGTSGVGPFSGLYDALAAAADNGVLVFNAAGNSAQQHWDGYSTAGIGTRIEQDFDPTGSGAYDQVQILSQKVDPGQSAGTEICAPVGLRAAFLAKFNNNPSESDLKILEKELKNYQIGAGMSWDDWADENNATDADYRLELVRLEDGQRSFLGYQLTPDRWVPVATSDHPQDGGDGQIPVEHLDYEPPAGDATRRCDGAFPSSPNLRGGIFALRVVRNTAGASNFLRLYSYNHQLLHQVEERSLSIPADAANVIAVAAINAKDSLLEPYSSRGPLMASGGKLPTGQAAGNAKPDLASFAAVATESYGSDPDAGLFQGTSAAAPHAAALSLLSLQHHRQLTSATAPAPLPTDATQAQRDARDALLRQRNADLANVTYDSLSYVAGSGGNDLGEVGFDASHGAGRLRFHANAGACFLGALYDSAYRALLPPQVAPLPEGEKSYDALHQENSLTCNTQ